MTAIRIHEEMREKTWRGLHNEEMSCLDLDCLNDVPVELCIIFLRMINSQSTTRDLFGFDSMCARAAQARIYFDCTETTDTNYCITKHIATNTVLI